MQFRFEDCKSIYTVFLVFACTAAAEVRSEWAFHSQLELAAGEKSAAIADVNNDGHADIVVAAEDEHEVSILLGDGNWTWSEPEAFPAGQNPTSISLADLNNDGNMDIVVANHEMPHLSLLLGKGNGSFETIEAAVSLDVLPHPHKVATIDLNNDQIIDIVTDSRDRDGVVAVRGLSEGRFAAPGRTYDVGGPPYLGFAVGDVNGDNLSDVVTPNTESVAIMLNQSTGSDIKLVRIDAVPFSGPFAVGLGDIDGDNHADLVVAAGHRGNSVAIFYGSGTGQFSAEPSATFELAAGAKQLLMGDFNGDSKSDIVISSWNGEAIVILKGAQQFIAEKLTLGGAHAPWGIATGDIDGDGRDDILLADAVSGVVNLYRGRQFAD